MNRSSDESETVSKAVPNTKAVSAWFDLMRTTEAFLRASMRRKLGPDGDLQEGCRRWYAEHMREHDFAVQELVRNLHRHEPGADHGR